MLNDKLQELRNRWKLEPANRTIITVQAKLIKLAMELESKKINSAPEVKTAEELADEVFKESGV
jgi:streptomycin 6-kinase